MDTQATETLDVLPPHTILRNARLEARLTLHYIGKISGHDSGHLSKIEHGKVGITPEVLNAYEQAIGRDLGIIAIAKTNKNPKKSLVKGAIHVMVTDHVIARWNEVSGVTHVSRRQTIYEPFGPWEEIPDPTG